MPKSRWIVLSILLILPVFILGYYYQWYSPNGGVLFCPSKRFFHIECVLCGGQRALYELLHGNLSKAFSYHPIFIISIPFLVFLYGQILYKTYQNKPIHFTFMKSNIFWWALLLFVIGFTIWRNV